MGNEAEKERAVKEFNDGIIQNHGFLKANLNSQALFGGNSEAEKDVRKWTDKTPDWQKEVLLFEFNMDGIAEGAQSKMAAQELKLALSDLNREFQDLNRKDSFSKTEWDADIAGKLDTVTQKLDAFNEITEMKFFNEPRMQAMIGFINGLKDVDLTLQTNALNMAREQLTADDNKAINTANEIHTIMENVPKECDENGLDPEIIAKGDTREITERLGEQISWLNRVEKDLKGITRESYEKVNTNLAAMENLQQYTKDFADAENAKIAAYNDFVLWGKKIESEAQYKRQEATTKLEQIVGKPNDGYGFENESLASLLEKTKNLDAFKRLPDQEKREEVLNEVKRQKAAITQCIKLDKQAMEMKSEAIKAAEKADKAKNKLLETINNLPIADSQKSVAAGKVHAKSEALDTDRFLGKPCERRIRNYPKDEIVGPNGLLNITGQVPVINAMGEKDFVEGNFNEFKAAFSESVKQQHKENVKMCKEVYTQNERMKAFTEGMKNVSEGLQQGKNLLRNSDAAERFNKAASVTETDKRMDGIKNSLNSMLRQLDATNKSGKHSDSPEYKEMRNQLAEAAKNPNTENLNRLAQLSQKYRDEKNKGVHWSLFAASTRNSRLTLAQQINKFAQKSVNTVNDVQAVTEIKNKINSTDNIPTTADGLMTGIKDRVDVSPEKMQKQYNNMMSDLTRIDKMRKERGEVLEGLGLEENLTTPQRPGMPKNLQQSKEMTKAEEEKKQEKKTEEKKKRDPRRTERKTRKRAAD